MRIFLSHGATERPTADRLAAALARLGLEIRDHRAYAADAAAFEVERQILACDYVVILVVPRTSMVVTPAVEAAVDRGYGNGRLLAMVTNELVQGDQAARGLVSALEERATRPPAHGRVPIVARTLRELEVADTSALPEATFHAIVEALDSAESWYRAKAYVEAAAALRQVDETFAEHLPDFRPYYAAIARSLCDLHLGLDALASTRLHALEGHPLRDESWSAAMAVIAMRGRRDAEARLHLRNAIAECRIHGTVRLEVLVDLCALPDPSYGDAPSEGNGRWWVARAARSLLAGRPEHAVLLLHGMPITAHDERSILLLARAYERLESWGAAAACLESYIASAGTAPVSAAVARQLARCHTAIGA